jgi:hypothetical protein
MTLMYSVQVQVPAETSFNNDDNIDVHVQNPVPSPANHSIPWYPTQNP